ncbi:MAG: hypothetical protein AAF558_03920 [Verrucomicrobiota bacterium]
MARLAFTVLLLIITVITSNCHRAEQEHLADKYFRLLNEEKISVGETITETVSIFVSPVSFSIQNISRVHRLDRHERQNVITKFLVQPDLKKHILSQADKTGTYEFSIRFKIKQIHRTSFEEYSCPWFVADVLSAERIR